MKKYADFFFNSSLPYEIPFLKKRIYELRETLNDEEKELMGKYVNLEALEYFRPFFRLTFSLTLSIVQTY